MYVLGPPRHQPALHIVRCRIERGQRAPGERGGQPGTLPEVLVGDLRDGNAEPGAELCLDRRELLALALEASGLGEVQIDDEHRDEATPRHAWSNDSSSGELALDLAGCVGLDDIAFLDVGEVTQHDAALVAGRHLTHILVEPPQAANLAVVYDRSVAHEAGLGAARDATLGDVAAGDRPHARGTEDLTDLDSPERLLDLLGSEHALHSVAQLLDRPVDDRVVADFHTLALSHGPGLADGTDVEGEDHGVGRSGEHDIGLGDRTDSAADDVDRYLFLGQLGDLVLDGFQRARHVGFEDQVELLLPAGEDVLEGDLLARPAGQRLGLQAGGPL